MSQSCGIIVMAFLCGFLYDYVWTVCIAAIVHHHAARAANYSVLIYLCALVSTVLIIEQQIPSILAFIAGSWLGTYWTVKRDEKKRKRQG